MNAFILIPSVKLPSNQTRPGILVLLSPPSDCAQRSILSPKIYSLVSLKSITTFLGSRYPTHVELQFEYRFVSKYLVQYLSLPSTSLSIFLSLVKATAWNETFELGYIFFTAKDVFERWRSIRDTFNKHRKDVKRTELESNGTKTYTPAWALWPLMEWYIPLWEGEPYVITCYFDYYRNSS